jgi:hypothetical protein
MWGGGEGGGWKGGWAGSMSILGLYCYFYNIYDMKKGCIYIYIIIFNIENHIFFSDSFLFN